MAGETTPLILLEAAWQEAVQGAVLFIYEFDPASFRLSDISAGYWISEEIQRPISTITVDNIPDHLEKLGIRVEYREEIASLAAAVAASSLRYSMIKMGNARAST